MTLGMSAACLIYSYALLNIYSISDCEHTVDTFIDSLTWVTVSESLTFLSQLFVFFIGYKYTKVLDRFVKIRAESDAESLLKSSYTISTNTEIPTASKLL